MAEIKRPEPTFYQAFTHPQKVEPGISLEVKRSIEFRAYYVDKCNLAELSELPLPELQDKRKDSVAAEKALFEKVLAAVQEWEAQATQTMLLDRAVEYVKTPAVKHTSNEWKRQKNGTWEISNLVYNMRYQISQQTEGNHKGQWLVAWGIAINKPKHPETEKYYYSGDTMVVEIKKKYYNSEADAQHYIQGRFDAYSHLFKELSPPVPDNFKRHFIINGVLLPGYTVAPPERSPQEVADALLNDLDDKDLLDLLSHAKEPQKTASTETEKGNEASVSAPQSKELSKPTTARKPSHPTTRKKLNKTPKRTPVR